MPTRSLNRDLNYLSKDFDSIKSNLVDYVKRQFPNTWRDFNDASGGMAILELMAYVGDVLSFNIDRQVNEAYMLTKIINYFLYITFLTALITLS